MKKLLLLSSIFFATHMVAQTPCYEQDADRIIVIEAENLIIPGTTDPNWVIVDDPNAGGGKYIRWDGANRFNKSLPPIGLLTANININVPNINMNLALRMRQSRFFENGDTVRGDLANDIFVYFPAPTVVTSPNLPTALLEYEKVFGPTRVAGGNPNRMEDSFKNRGNYDRGGRRPTVTVSFPAAGMYRIEFAARSKGYQLDRILMFPGGRRGSGNQARLKAINLNTFETLCTPVTPTAAQIEAARNAQIHSESVDTAESAFVLGLNDGLIIRDARVIYERVLAELEAAGGPVPLINSNQQAAQEALDQLQAAINNSSSANTNLNAAVDIAENTTSLSEAENALATAESELQAIQNALASPASSYVTTAEQMAEQNELFGAYSSAAPDPRMNRNGNVNFNLIYEATAADAATATRSLATQTSNLAATTDFSTVLADAAAAVERAQAAVDALDNILSIDSVSAESETAAILYPNPVKKSGTLRISNLKNNTVLQVQLLNSLGSVVLSEEVNVVDGEGSIRIPGSIQTGIYFVQLTAEGNNDNTVVSIIVN